MILMWSRHDVQVVRRKEDMYIYWLRAYDRRTNSVGRSRESARLPCCGVNQILELYYYLVLFINSPCLPSRRSTTSC